MHFGVGGQLLGSANWACSLFILDTPLMYCNTLGDAPRKGCRVKSQVCHGSKWWLATHVKGAESISRFYEFCSPARDRPMPTKFLGRVAEHRTSSELSVAMGSVALSMATGTEARRLEYPIYS